MKSPKMWVEIVCHNCSVQGPGQWISGGKVPISELKLQAMEQGFRMLTSGDFECAKCTAYGLKGVRP